MIDTKTFRKLLGDEMKASGFAKSGTVWLRRAADLTIVIEAQKSNYDATFFINVGWSFRELGGDALRTNRCHIQCTADAFVRSRGRLRLLDLACQEWEPDEHATQLQDFLRTDVVPVLRELADIHGLRAAWTRGELNRCLVMSSAEALLMR